MEQDDWGDTEYAKWKAIGSPSSIGSTEYSKMKNINPNTGKSYYNMYGKSNSQNCFVTTAAYGDAYHPMVCTFRQFRDEIIINFKIGCAFNTAYTKFGPEAARLLDRSLVLKAFARWMLTPVAICVKATLRVIKRNSEC